MDLEITVLSKSERERSNTIWQHLYVESKKRNYTNELAYKTETNSDIENKLTVTRVGRMK